VVTDVQLVLLTNARGAVNNFDTEFSISRDISCKPDCETAQKLNIREYIQHKCIYCIQLVETNKKRLKSKHMMQIEREPVATLHLFDDIINLHYTNCSI
jgi:hypothetical protein